MKNRYYGFDSEAIKRAAAAMAIGDNPLIRAEFDRLRAEQDRAMKRLQDHMRSVGAEMVRSVVDVAALSRAITMGYGTDKEKRRMVIMRVVRKRFVANIY